jgi:class 3 adenylate cyclase/tetratricopeptide (TPR) repeat protein
MQCTSCDHHNPDQAKFCLECGSAFERSCSECGTALPAEAKFCLECGTAIGVPRAAEPVATRNPLDYTPKHLADKILQSKSALEGERKQVTVMFADVKGSMELAEQLDPEEWHGILERFFEILTEGVHRFEGTVNQYTGDGIMALFGAPIAHEDHAQRACYAALHLQGELANYAIEVKREHGLGFSTRIGIHSGDVVVGRIGDDLRMDYTAQGHTVGLAQRLESLAEPNTCYLSDTTAQLAAGYFALTDLGDFTVKGVSQPLRVFELEGMGSLRTRLDVAQSRGFTQLVGREEELQLLESALTRASEGQAPLIGIVGEAGLGKSRLCFEFMELCRARGLSTYEASGASHGQSIPFLPVLGLFRSFFEITEQDDDEEARERITSQLRASNISAGDSLALLFDFLGVPDPLHPAPRQDPDVLQRQLIDLLRRVVQMRSQNEPLVLLLEDLHWFDGASAAFLEPLIESLMGTRTLVLLNFRPEYRAPWSGRSFYHQLPVVPLGSKGTRSLLEALLGADASLGELANFIHAGTAGNPFFTEEVVQHLVESGKLEGRKGAFRLVAKVDTLEVPNSVQALLAARIDRLAESDKDVLRTAAVIGREFDAPTLAAVLQQDVSQLQIVLRSLKDAEFVFEQSLYPVAEYLFKHPLTHEVALNSQLQDRRKRLHARVADVLESTHGDELDQQAALLAHHWENAGEARQAALWHKRAAEWAGLRNAAEGMRHWQRTRSLLLALPQTNETMEIGVAACQGMLGLGWRLGIPAAEATKIFEDGRDLAENVGDVGALAALHGTYACVLGLVAGEADEYVRYSREAVRLADETEDQGLQLAERAYLAFASVFAGRMEDGIERCEATCRSFPADPALGAEYTGYSPFLGVLNAHAWMLVRAGRLIEGEAVCERAENLARLHGDDEILTWVQLVRIEADIVRADVNAARQHTIVAVQTTEISDTPQSHQVNLMVSGVLHRLESRWDQSVDTLEEALHGAAHGANRELEGWVGAELAFALIGRGDLDRAEQEAQTAIEVGRLQKCRCDEARGSLALVHTLLHRDTPALDRAENALDRAQALIDETSGRVYQPDLHECRARIARLRGDEVAARGEIEQARRVYSEMGATFQVARLINEWNF